MEWEMTKAPLIRWGWLEQAGFGDDLMDVLIVKLDGDVIHDLHIEGDSDALGAAAGVSKQPVVVTTAATEALSIMRERETRNENDVECGDIDGRAVQLRLPDVHLAALQIVGGANLAWLECLMGDLEKAGSNSLRMESRQQPRHKLRLIFQATKESNGSAWSPRGSEMREMGGDVYAGLMSREFIHGTQTLTHGLTKRGFVVHALQ
jgi:hypothetical protein